MISYTLCYIAIFIIEAVIAWMYFEAIFEGKRTVLYTISLYVLGYILLFFVSRLENSIVNTTAFLIVNVSIVLLLYRCKIAPAVLHCAFLTFVMSITEVIVALILERITGDYGSFRYSFPAMLAVASSSKIMYLLVSSIASKLLRPEKAGGNNAAYIVLLCILPVISIVITLTIVYIGLNYELTGITDDLMSASTLLLLVLNIVVLLVYRYIQHVTQINSELRIASIRETASAEYYDMLQTQYENQRILIHDIKAHLSAIEELAKESDSTRVEKYVEQLQSSQALVTRITFCPEPVLNAILMRYNEMCQEQNLNFMCDIRASVSFLDDTSITSLFENLLSNAFEASSKVAEGYIELSISNPGGVGTSTIVTVVNSCGKKPERNVNGELETGKPDKASHGYGMKSIARVIRKYGGSMKTYFDETANEFHVVLCFDC